MNTKVIVGGLVGAIVMFLLGWLIYGMLLGMLLPEMFGMPEGSEPGATSLLWIFIANLAVGLLLAYVFSRWANISTPMGGLMAAMVIGLLLAVCFDSYVMAFPEMYTEDHQMTIGSMIVDVIASTLITMGGGATIGWYFGRGNSASE